MSKQRLNSYEYPGTVNELIERFRLCVEEIYMDEDPGVLLVGSAARGELSWVELEGDINLFSDIEFLVAVDMKNAAKERSLKQKITSLEKEYQLGALFHIDYVVIPWRKLPKLDRKFFVFESKQCGIDIGSVPIRSELPDVDKSNLNWTELNEVYLHRMNAVLNKFPIKLLDNKDNDEQIFVLALAKNTLDVTTWLHPYEADSLIAGFGPRLNNWEKELPGRLLGEYITSDDLDYLRLCLKIRKKPYIKMNARTMLERYLDIYRKAESYCKAVNKIDSHANISNLIVSFKLFDEYCLRRRLREIYQILMGFRKLGIKRVLSNIALPRKGIQTRFCCQMLEAVALFMHKDEGCWESINTATTELSRLVPNNVMPSHDFVTIWENNRARYKSFCQIIT